MKESEQLTTPLIFLGDSLGDNPDTAALAAYEHWWVTQGQVISEAVDRAGTPWLRMFDRAGTRIDEVCYPPDYWAMLRKGYREGIISRVFEQNSVLPFYRIGYITAFHDPGLYCPYTVSLATAVPLEKYGSEALKARFLPQLLRTDDEVWQGATWMTEIKGGSDLGANVETIAREQGDHWLLSGDKYFASNLGADLAVVAAHPEGAPRDVRGLALFLLPRLKQNGELNYTVRRIKDKIATRSVPTGEIELRDSEAWLLGSREQGVYLILEVLNISRVANSIASVALAQRAMAEATAFARQRQAFGKAIIEHPLLQQQFRERQHGLQAAMALACKAARMLDEVWRQTPPYNEQYHLFRLLAHLAKYWTAEFAAQTCKWAMEVHGGLGVLAEYPVERWFRESMILSIWEGTAHRQILDGLEVMQRKAAHKLLFEHLRPAADPDEIAAIEVQVERHLQLLPDEQEAGAATLFSDLARFTAETLRAS
ncbi:MAG: acyl-CoA dehydrogenase family protein [Gammaproteobacteria bacterium]|nr:MAG: acyl-CoA dehydrogenase family protein [Gammaproteobacteria bacterium]